MDRKTLSFGKGMTNVPSDLLSEDSELAYSQNIIYRNGEMIPIQKMKPFGTVSGTILFVHKMADFENIITYDRDPGTNKYTIRCYKKSDDLITEIGTFEGDGEVKDVQAVGNTLVLATDNGLRYILYKSETYKDLGMNMPDLKCNFTFEKPSGNYIPEESGRTLMNISNDVDGPDIWKCYYDANGKFLQAGGDDPGVLTQQGTYYHFSIKATDSSYYRGFQETVQGHVAQAINWVKSKNMFAFPFFVRCAFRLFDGSYAKITTPYICYPTINRNCRFSSATFDTTNNTYMDLRQMTGTGSIFYFIEYSELKFKFERISNDWSDIIREIVVFASDQVLPFRLDSGWKIVSPNDTYMRPSANFGYNEYKELSFDYNRYLNPPSHDIQVHSEIQPEYKTDQEIIDELLTKSQFYKLFSVGVSDKVMDGNWHFSVNGRKDGDKAFIAKGVVENLTTQPQLPVDDYYGWANITAERLYTYNGRLQAIGLLRYPFGGFSNLQEET